MRDCAPISTRAGTENMNTRGKAQDARAYGAPWRRKDDILLLKKRKRGDTQSASCGVYTYARGATACSGRRPTLSPPSAAATCAKEVLTGRVHGCKSAKERRRAEPLRRYMVRGTWRKRTSKGSTTAHCTRRALAEPQACFEALLFQASQRNAPNPENFRTRNSGDALKEAAVAWTYDMSTHPRRALARAARKRPKP